MGKKKGWPKKETTPKPPVQCEFCGAWDCDYLKPHAGWPKRAGWPYTPDFSPYELRLRT